MHIDHDLQQRFDALRRADRVAAPDVDAIMRRPAMRRPPRVRLRAALIAATVLLVFAGVRLATRRTPAVVPSVLTWRSPTAVLLETPGRDLLIGTPTLRSSVLTPGGR